eukprot:scaffold311392_cov22-Tisochrysis_lutea.AAC.1
MISGTSKADQGAAHNQCNDQAQTDLYAREAAGKQAHALFCVCTHRCRNEEGASAAGGAGP